MTWYHVRPAPAPVQCNADVHQPCWQAAEVLELRHFMGGRPVHFPRVQARLLYDTEAIHVLFQVEDAFVLAVARAHQQAVYRDSCVEFFFTPAADLSPSYFNLEMNCGGLMLFHFQTAPRQGQPIKEQDVATIAVAHTLPQIIEPETGEPTGWAVQYRLPLVLLDHYFPGTLRPAPGKCWRANFYKCADASSHPHWLTWAPVDDSKPNFHRPDCFGQLLFE